MKARRVAALYDIHGNLPALEAVLAELESEGVDLVLVGGDVAWGPLPRETLDRLAALEGVLLIRGNADREVAARHRGHDETTDAITLWCADQLRPEQLDLLASLPERVTVEVAGLGPTLFCHGSPRSDEEPITAATSEKALARMLAGVEETTVVFGHTHAQFERRASGKRLVNPGSVGLPFGERGAYWALLGHAVELRRTGYDVEEAAERFRRSGAPSAKAAFADHVLAPPPWSTAAELFTRG